jgi:hypothetical protein
MAINLSRSMDVQEFGEDDPFLSFNAAAVFLYDKVDV